MTQIEIAPHATALPDLTRCLADTRAEAGVLLSTLLSERSLLEAHRHESGAIDPIEKLTGASSIDRAIASTRDIIRDLDSRLIETKALRRTDVGESPLRGEGQSPLRGEGAFDETPRAVRATVVAETEARTRARNQSRVR